MKKKAIMRLWTCMLMVATLMGCDKNVGNEPRPRTTDEAQQTFITLQADLSDDDLKASTQRFEVGGNGLLKLDLNSLKEADGKIYAHCVIRGTGGGLAESVTYVRVPLELDNARHKLVVRDLPVTLQGESSWGTVPGRKWYITGTLGGRLDQNSGVRVHYGYDPNNEFSGTLSVAEVGAQKLSIPYMFPWTELAIDQDGKGGAFNLRFKPRGALIKTSFKNASNIPLYGASYRIVSNVMDDAGYFDYSSGSISEGSYPNFVAVDYSAGRKYRMGGAINVMLPPNGNTEGCYHWVMPREGANSASADTHVAFSDTGFVTQESTLITQVAKLGGTVVTDHTAGIPQHGKSYTLTTYMNRPKLPIEYVYDNEYDAPWIGYSGPAGDLDPRIPQVAWKGLVPEVTFYHDLSKITIPSGTHIPSEQEWRGIFPIHLNTTYIYFRNPSKNGKIDIPQNIIEVKGERKVYRATVNVAGGDVAYAILLANGAVGEQGWGPSETNRYRCAVKYELSTPTIHERKIKVSVAYLGDRPLTIDDISAPSYWSSLSPSEIIVREFDCSSSAIYQASFYETNRKGEAGDTIEGWDEYITDNTHGGYYSRGNTTPIYALKKSNGSVEFTTGNYSFDYTGQGSGSGQGYKVRPFYNQ